MQIILATDHAGLEHKQAVKAALEADQHEVIDCGAHSYDPDDDYPDFIQPAMERVVAGSDATRAIIFGGSGQGEAMLANKYRGVRAAVYYGGPIDILTLSRAHNDANVLSLGARFITTDETVTVVMTWLDTVFSGDDRHVRRLQKFTHSY